MKADAGVAPPPLAHLLEGGVQLGALFARGVGLARDSPLLLLSRVCRLRIGAARPHARRPRHRRADAAVTTRRLWPLVTRHRRRRAAIDDSGAHDERIRRLLWRTPRLEWRALWPDVIDRSRRRRLPRLLPPRQDA